MKTALRLLLAPYRFSVDRIFRMGEIGGAHWFTDPNTLYRRRNRLTYTRDFSNAAWTKTNILSVTADADGVGDLVVPNTTNATHILVQAVGSIGVPSVLTIRAKAGGYNHIAVTAGTPTGYANVNTGTAGTVSGGMTVDVSPSSDATGYFDAVFTYTPTSVNTTIYIANADGSPSYAGDGTSGVYLARAQLETYTTTPTEYQDVPTTWAQAYLDAVGAENIYAWTDSAGTTPVTAVGQTIGLSLDRAYGGYRGPELKGTGAVGLAGVATAATYNTTTGAGTCTRVDLSNQSFVYLAGLTNGGTYYISITNTGSEVISVRSGTQSGTILQSLAASATFTGFVTLTTATLSITTAGGGAGGSFTLTTAKLVPGTHLIQATGTARPTLSARVNMLLNTATMSTQNVTTIAASYRLRFDGTGTVTLSGTATAGPLSAGTHSVTATAGTLTLTVSGSVTSADFRTADDAAKNIPAYQRVGATAADHDTDGFPHYALFDGTDDSWASAAAVDGSATDKLTVVAGVTKNSDAVAYGTIFETSNSVNSVNGTAAAFAPGGAGTYQVYSRGTVAEGFTSLSYSGPHSAVLAASLDNGASTAATQRVVSINSVVGSNGGTTTAGNFGNHTLYVGRRAGTSLPLNGRIYALIGRFGAMSDSERNRLGAWVKNLMRLP